MKKYFPVFLIIVVLFSIACAPPKIDLSDADDKQLVTEVKPGGPIPSVNIEYISAGNAKIQTTFYEASEKNSPAVLLLHQWQSNRKSYDAFAVELQKQGFGVLAIDGRGFGESVVTTDDKDLKPDRSDEAVDAMKTDVDNAFLLLADQKNVDPDRIGIVGASYGSSLAIIYGAGNKKVKAVALLSPGTNYFGNLPTEPAMKAYGERPLLMVAANDDKESADSVTKLAAATESKKTETKVYPKGGHGTNLFAAKVGLEELLIKFLKENLK